MDDELREDRVWCTVGGTINMGDYNNIKIDMGQSRTVAPDEEPDEVRLEITRTILEDFLDISEEIKPGGKGKPPSGRRQEPAKAPEPQRTRTRRRV